MLIYLFYLSIFIYLSLFIYLSIYFFIYLYLSLFHFIWSSGICKLKAKDYRGFIESPNYPNDYPRSSDCGWILDFGPGIFIKVQFNDFVLEEQITCSFDYVSILDGPNQTSPVLQGTTTYCGNLKPPTVIHLGPLTILFRSDKDTAKKGFSASYETWGNLISFMLVVPNYNKMSKIVYNIT